MPSIGRPSGICGRPWRSRPTSTICSALRTGALIRNRRDSGGDAANLFGTFCPKEPGLGRLPNKHFCGPAAQQKFRVWPHPNCLPFMRSPIHGAKNGGRAFPYAPSVSLAFLIPSAAPSMMISSFSSIPFSIRSMCFRRSLSPPSLSG